MTTNDTSTDDARSQTPITIITNAARFAPGQIVATRGALVLLQKTGFSVGILIARHLNGDFGDTCRDDAALNELAITDGSRIMSVYPLKSGLRFNTRFFAAYSPMSLLSLPSR